MEFTLFINFCCSAWDLFYFSILAEAMQQLSIKKYCDFDKDVLTSMMIKYYYGASNVDSTIRGSCH